MRPQLNRAGGGCGAGADAFFARRRSLGRGRTAGSLSTTGLANSAGPAESESGIFTPLRLMNRPFVLARDLKIPAAKAEIGTEWAWKQRRRCSRLILGRRTLGGASSPKREVTVLARTVRRTLRAVRSLGEVPKSCGASPRCVWSVFIHPVTSCQAFPELAVTSYQLPSHLLPNVYPNGQLIESCSSSSGLAASNQVDADRGNVFKLGMTLKRFQGHSFPVAV